MHSQPHTSLPSARPRSPPPRRRKLRIACVQYDPKLKDVGGNEAKVMAMTDPIPPNSLDILLLPEMALTGYMFSSPSDIAPYLEHPKRGPTARLCQELAKKKGCWVVAGYPEQPGSEEDQDGQEMKEGEQDGEGGIPSSSRTATTATTTTTKTMTTPKAEAEAKVAFDYDPDPCPPTYDSLHGNTNVDVNVNSDSKNKTDPKISAPRGFNSALLVSPQGNIHGNYRKSFLFDTDKAWAKEGSGFQVWDLGGALGKVVLGICMDMNPKDFIAPWDAYELSNFVKQHQADTLIVPMNWLTPSTSPEDGNQEENKAGSESESYTDGDGDGPEMSTLNYWAHRLTPLHDPVPSYTLEGVREGEDAGGGVDGKEVVFICCNRVGTEKGTTFVGTSSVMRMSSNPSRIQLIETLGRKEEGLLLAEVQRGKE